MSGLHNETETGRSGFTLIEVVVALFLLTVGLLGLASTTGFVLRQTTFAGATTERAMALESVVSELRSLPFDSIDAGSRTAGDYAVSWWVAGSGDGSKTVEVETVGPGLNRVGEAAPAMGADVADTLTLRLVASR